MSIRVKREIEVKLPGKGGYKRIKGYYPEEWICALKGCIRQTTSAQRKDAKRRGRIEVFCCRKHEWMARNGIQS